MKYQRRSFLRLVICSSGALMLGGCMKKPGSVQSDVDYYTCTMHPPVRSQDPQGKCPICGMGLVQLMKRGATLSAASMNKNNADEFTVPVEWQQQIGVTYATVVRN